jgi:cytochrome c oxidase subunit 3
MAHVALHTQSPTAPVFKPHSALHDLPKSRLQGRPGRPDAVAVGTIIWLASELMFFAGLFAAYFTIKNVTTAEAVQAGLTPLWHQGASLLNVKFAIANTTVLVLSSVTCQRGVFLAEHGRVGRIGSVLNPANWGMREWYALTFLMGAFFVGGQAYEYSGLIHDGLTMSSDAYGSIFYLATGFHALHVTGGLVAFVLLLGRTYLARTFTHEQAVSAIAVSYYWHFVDVVWIALFGVIYILQ